MNPVRSILRIGVLTIDRIILYVWLSSELQIVNEGMSVLGCLYKNVRR